MSQVVKHLNDWFGIRHVVSLVDRHESNGVEGTNKLILRHLRTLTQDLRLVKQWAHPTVLPLIVFAINDAVSSETGVRPFEAKFGSADATYMRMPPSLPQSELTHEFVRLLNANLDVIREVSNEFMRKTSLCEK